MRARLLDFVRTIADTLRTLPSPLNFLLLLAYVVGLVLAGIAWFNRDPATLVPCFGYYTGLAGFIGILGLVRLKSHKGRPQPPSRFWAVAMAVFTVVMAAGCVGFWLRLPPELPLTQKAYWLFDKGYANNWVPQIYYTDGATMSRWKAEDFRKAIESRFAPGDAAQGSENCQMISFRPRLADQGWLGVAWALQGWDDMNAGKVHGVNLTDAATIEFDARSDRQLGVEFKALVAGNSDRFKGDRSDSPLGASAELTDHWRHIVIPLQAVDLSRVVTPFYVGVAANQQTEPLGPDEAVNVYVANIRWTFPSGQVRRELYIWARGLCACLSCVSFIILLVYLRRMTGTRHMKGRLNCVASASSRQ